MNENEIFRHRVLNLMSDVRFSGSMYRMKILVGWAADTDRVYLQAEQAVRNVITGQSEFLKGRKWHLSPHMTDGEIVQTALMATLAFVEHEVREAFTYKDKRIFGPHLQLDALVEVADRTEHRS